MSTTTVLSSTQQVGTPDNSLIVKAGTPPQQSPQQQQQQQAADRTNLIINYIPTALTSDELRSLFAPYGNVMSARVICDPVSGEPKGYGFVKFGTEEQALTARSALDGFRVYNKHLRVTPAMGGGCGGGSRFVPWKDLPDRIKGNVSTVGSSTGGGTSSSSSSSGYRGNGNNANLRPSAPVAQAAFAPAGYAPTTAAPQVVTSSQYSAPPTAQMATLPPQQQQQQQQHHQFVATAPAGAPAPHSFVVQHHQHQQQPQQIAYYVQAPITDQHQQLQQQPQYHQLVPIPQQSAPTTSSPPLHHQQQHQTPSSTKSQPMLVTLEPQSGSSSHNTSWNPEIAAAFNEASTSEPLGQQTPSNMSSSLTSLTLAHTQSPSINPMQISGGSTASGASASSFHHQYILS